MKKLFTLVLAMIMTIAVTAFATYRVVMNNLKIDQVEDNNIIISVFGLTDEYRVDEPDIYYINRNGIELYSPIPDGATVEQLYKLKADTSAFKQWLEEEKTPATHIKESDDGSFIYIKLEVVDIDNLIQSAINYNLLVRVVDDTATVMPVGLFPFRGEGWDITGVQPLN